VITRLLMTDTVEEEVRCLCYFPLHITISMMPQCDLMRKIQVPTECSAFQSWCLGYTVHARGGGCCGGCHGRRKRGRGAGREGGRGQEREVVITLMTADDRHRGGGGKA
jgi:hypothetical protein